MSADETNEPDDKLPAGVPEPPDLQKVRDMRERLRQSRRKSGAGEFRPGPRIDEKKTRQARDIGMYTIIPMMMVAGPAIGYLLGLFIQKTFGGEPWPVVVGALFGLAAAFRQIYLMLANKAEQERRSKRP
jgi:F0F1-type ATP synthase assembly protein I